MLKGADRQITPDLMADLNGKTYFFEIAMKSPNRFDVKGKWMFLKTLTEMKGYHFRMFLPKGHVSFARALVAEIDLKITLIKI